MSRYIVPLVSGLMGLVLVVAVILLLTRGRVPQPAPVVTSPVTAPARTPITMATTSEIKIGTQRAGDRVTVDYVRLSQHGFVAIYENDMPGKMVGASNIIIFPETFNFKIVATLMRGHTYTAALHTDNGDGIFNENDDPLLHENGKRIEKEFSVK